MAYKKYQQGENAELDKALADLGQDYTDARKQNDWQGMTEANNKANQLRNEYGYAAEFATEDINKIRNQASGSSSGGGFSYESAPSYTSRYDDLIQQVSDKLLNRPEFSYDAESDPAYQQYKKQYTKAGERAMQDTLGEVSARTGGLASSYATTASQQTFDNYMSALADKVPELQQLAYQMYQDEGNEMLSQLNMLLALDDADYAKYQGILNQYNADRSFNYGVFSDNRNYNYQVGRDLVSDTRYDREWLYGLEQDQYAKDMDRAALLAQNGDFSGYADLWGLSDSQVQNMVDQYAKQQNLTDQQAAMELASFYAQYGDFSKLKEFGVDTSYLSKVQNAELANLYSSGKKSSGSSSGSSSKKSSSSSSTSSNSDIYQTLYDSGIRTEGDAYAALLAAGYNTTQAGKLAGYYTDWMKNKSSESSGDDYENAEIEWGSVIDLGYGPLNEDGLAELESQGKIKSYISNNKIYFKRVENKNSNKTTSQGALDWIFNGFK